MSGEPVFYIVATRPGDTFQLVAECAGPVVVGRDPANAVVLPHPLVSRRHLQISRAGDGFEFEDLESRNGTVLDGEPLVGIRLTAGPSVAQAGPFILSVSNSVAEETWTAAHAVRPPRTMLDRGRRQFRIDGALALEVLSAHEYAVLDVLAASSHEVVDRATLGNAVWGAGQWDVYMLHNLVSRVRKRISQGGADGDVIVNVPGVGYRLE